jgi:hypothetical protein
MILVRLLSTITAVILPPLFLLNAFVIEPRSNRSPLPKLSETGLYSDIATKTIAPGNLRFSPQYPLWSDGAKKKRWIYLPPKRSIDASRVDDWVFPIGTKIWKEFSFGKRVETRYLEKVGKGVWVYATYAWNENETDADLVPETGLPNHVAIAAGVRHDIPGISDCKACHEGQGRDVVLGFNALQLSPDRDPNTPHAEQVTPEMINLKNLVDQKLLMHLPERFTIDPPVVLADSPRARTALGYLSSNCGGCHNSTDPLSTLGMYLKRSIGISPGAAKLELETVIGHKSKYPIPGLELDQSYRILPGDSSKSAVVYRMSSRDPYRQMPPLGTKIIDREALDLITKWIQEDLTNSNAGKYLTHK